MFALGRALPAARAYHAREGRVVGKGRDGQALAVVEVADRVGLDAGIVAVHVAPLVAPASGWALAGQGREAGRVGIQAHRGRHVVDQPVVAVAVEARRGQVFELAGKQRRVTPDDVAHRHPVAGLHIRKHDDLQARVLEHGRLQAGGFLLVADLVRLDHEPAAVDLFGMRLDGDDFVERLVVADVVLRMIVQRLARGQRLDLLDSEQVAAVRLDHEMPDVAVDHDGMIGAGVASEGRMQTQQ